MNITNTSTTQIEQIAKLNSRSAAEEQTPKKQSMAEKSTTEVSDLSKSIGSTFENLASQPDVDMEMVSQVKAAIANGEFEIDIDATVNAIIELHK